MDYINCKININQVIKQSKVEGFGKRYCIWVQGCSLHCHGCKNSHMWSFKGGKIYSINDLIRDIKSQNGIEGVTILGGEPLDQKKAVSLLVKEIKKCGLSVILFTGYLYKDLKNSENPFIKVILENVDILIDGPYIESRTDYKRPWIGSENQEYYFLSDRYSKNDIRILDNKSRYELRIYHDGTISINGIGSLEKIERFIKFCEQ